MLLNNILHNFKINFLQIFNQPAHFKSRFSFLVSSCQGCVANLIERAELKGDTVDTFGEGVADVDAADGLDESANLQEVLREICKN